MRILILGASYGSLLSTKLLMAGHDVTLICRSASSALINAEGTKVRLKLRDESEHRVFCSGDLPGTLEARTPDEVDPGDYALVVLAMQEPHYSAPLVRNLVKRVALSGRPCLSIMNMPPLPFLRRIEALRDIDLSECYDDASVWSDFDPDFVSLCSPDPQAFRPPEEGANILHVGLPTNFKASDFARSEHSELLRSLEADIESVRIDGKEIPVKLRVSKSIFVPLAKWSMLIAGNYRCIGIEGVRSIRDAVHDDLESSSGIYDWVSSLVRSFGADSGDQVAFEKYSAAASGLVKPSSVARAIESGVVRIERVDRLIQRVAASRDMSHPCLDEIVSIVDARLDANASASVLSA